MVLIAWTDKGVEHFTGILIDSHCLEDVEGAWNVPWVYIPGLEDLLKIFPAAMIGDLFWLFRIRIDPFSKDPLCQSLCNQFKSLPAAHPLLQVMPAFFKTVLHYGEHGIVQLGYKLITGTDVDLCLIRLCPCLIKPLRQIIEIEGHKIHHAPTRNPYPLSLLDHEGLACIFRDNHAE